ncbi:ribosome biogenesis protein SLX9 homolog isoform X9 [Kogia breviceps]|uniref:ribosome biogenesis protein SLX9 homolog isoform X9 n=1 Tax=Kogia breviceps TaxID=27615 RepID=UPI0034D178C7
MEVHIGHCSSILNRLTCLHSSRVCHTGCQGQGCFAQEGEAEAEAREVAAEDRSREAGGAEARGGAETQGHGGGRGPAAPEGRPARAAGAGDGWTAVCSCEVRGRVCKSVLTCHADRKSGDRKTTLRAAARPRAAQPSRTSAAQRLRLLEEERTRFQELLASPAYRANPLQVTGQQLAQQMRLEGGGQS